MHAPRTEKKGNGTEPKELKAIRREQGPADRGRPVKFERLLQTSPPLQSNADIAVCLELFTSVKETAGKIKCAPQGITL